MASNFKRPLLLLGTSVVALGLVLLTSAFTSPKHGASPSITWDPPSVDVVITPGETREVSVAFAASRVLRRIRVKVDSELAGFVQADPSQFERIHRNDTTQVTLSISSGDAQLGTVVEGQVGLVRAFHLLRRWFFLPLEHTLPVRIAVLERFIDPNNRYSLAIPTDAVAEYVDEEDLTLVRLQPPEIESPALVISIDENPNNLSPQEYYDGEPGLDLFGHSAGIYAPISVGDGAPALRFSPVVTLSDDVIVVVPREQEFIRISDRGASFSRAHSLDQILHSLRF